MKSCGRERKTYGAWRSLSCCFLIFVWGGASSHRKQASSSNMSQGTLLLNALFAILLKNE